MDFAMYFKSFVVGGLICVIGQILIDKTKLTPARILTSYVIAGIILSAFNLYTPLIKFAGAGASVPLIGFGNLLATGTKQMIVEKGFLGAIGGGMTASASGISAAIFFGFLAAVIFKTKDKA